MTVQIQDQTAHYVQSDLDLHNGKVLLSSHLQQKGKKVMEIVSFWTSLQNGHKFNLLTLCNWLKELQESMDGCSCCRDITEILLKTALNTIQYINQPYATCR